MARKGTRQPRPAKPAQRSTPARSARHSNDAIVVVMRTGPQPAFNAHALRNDINKALGKNAVSLVSVTTRGHIEIRPAPKSDPRDIFSARASWSAAFASWPVSAILPAGEWYEVCAHSVPTAPFAKLSPEARSNLLRQELSEFNGISISAPPRWTCDPATTTKSAVPVIIKLGSEEDCNKVLKGISICGVHTTVDRARRRRNNKDATPAANTTAPSQRPFNNPSAVPDRASTFSPAPPAQGTSTWANFTTADLNTAMTSHTMASFDAVMTSDNGGWGRDPTESEW